MLGNMPAYGSEAYHRAQGKGVKGVCCVLRKRMVSVVLHILVVLERYHNWYSRRASYETSIIAEYIF